MIKQGLGTIAFFILTSMGSMLYKNYLITETIAESDKLIHVMAAFSSFFTVSFACIFYVLILFLGRLGTKLCGQNIAKGDLFEVLVSFFIVLSSFEIFKIAVHHTWLKDSLRFIVLDEAFKHDLAATTWGMYLKLTQLFSLIFLIIVCYVRLRELNYSVKVSAIFISFIMFGLGVYSIPDFFI
ncbi:hypothetical protein [Sphingobacterium deserti]|uniref:Uncharacterized protein n=1 Tax=Sphingobacterium deserti TaxID=1229276 RepID=A0A0B8T4L2_9SPHI|nr:hypothetical protein [Sphingobacterium deserti]KGE14873.1 hypothetical protein DI53_1373 [Sphingobacterium deserti]